MRILTVNCAAKISPELIEQTLVAAAVDLEDGAASVAAIGVAVVDVAADGRRAVEIAVLEDHVGERVW